MWFTIRRRNHCTKDTSDRMRHSFPSLIKRRNFDKIIGVLQDETSDITAWLDKYAIRGSSKVCATPFQLFKSHLPLHTALQYRPPVELVDLLIGRLAQHDDEGSSGVVATQNMLGQSPLHLAVVHGCDICVIERLLQDMSPTLTPRDIWGRTPLHWIVANDSAVNVGCFGSTSKKLRRDLDSKVKIITAITASFPSFLHIRDKEGFTALELGISHEADGALLYLLRKASQQHNAHPKNDLTVCNNRNKIDSKPNWCPRPIGTPDTSLSHLSNVDSDIPLEIIEMTDSCYLSGDDASSVGSGGISKFHHPTSRPQQRLTRKLFPLLYERVKL